MGHYVMPINTESLLKRDDTMKVNCAYRAVPFVRTVIRANIFLNVRIIIERRGMMSETLDKYRHYERSCSIKHEDCIGQLNEHQLLGRILIRSADNDDNHNFLLELLTCASLKLVVIGWIRLNWLRVHQICG